jgi:nucleoid DNA-binding protein
MTVLSEYIADLLRKYNCVIIPGFGGLIANDHHSYINHQRKLIYPPGKSIAFNQNLSTNDGLLADHIASTQHIPYSSALILIQQFVEDLTKNLQDGKQEEISSVGSFHLSDDQKIQFGPESKENLSLDSYGFIPVHAVAVKREEDEAPIRQIESTVKDKRTKSKELRSKNKDLRTKNKRLTTNNQQSATKTFTYISSAAACLALAFFVYSYINTPKNTNLSTLIPADTTADVFSLGDILGYTPSLPVPAIETIPHEDVDTVFIGSVNKKTETIPAKNNKIESYKNVYASSGKKYQIVGGVFRSETNAINYVEDLKNKGVNASLIRTNSGRTFRVILGDYDSLADAEKQLQEAKKSNQDAWILTL